jgi:hypothetical protein
VINNQSKGNVMSPTALLEMLPEDEKLSEEVQALCTSYTCTDFSNCNCTSGQTGGGGCEATY